MNKWPGGKVWDSQWVQRKRRDKEVKTLMEQIIVLIDNNNSQANTELKPPTNSTDNIFKDN